ncbi:MAG: hypothetical protein HYV97_12290 [Bdellovibrio sp.]|nr:hypothetical protein [Bdellovibrio sp.]
MQWKKIDQTILGFYPYLTSEDDCRFAYEYTGGGSGYAAGVINSDVLNFKKSGLKRNVEPEWSYRNEAVNKFAGDLSVIINNTTASPLHITAIPASKIKSDSEYSFRYEDLFTVLKSFRPRTVPVSPIDQITSALSSHTGGTRNPQQIMSNYKWNGFGTEVVDKLVVVDDVLTTGAHFKAYKDFLRQNGFAGQLIGLFWARRT